MNDTHADDGNLVAKDQRGLTYWASGLNAIGPNAYAGPFALCILPDGNVVIYGLGTEYGFPQVEEWSTNTRGRGTAPFYLSILSNGNIVLTDSTQKQLWSSNTTQS